MPCAPHLTMVEHSSGLGDRGRETVPAHPHRAQGACDQGQVGTSERADTGPRCLHRPPQPSSATPCGMRLWPTTDDGGVATAGDRADPSQLCRPTRTPVGLGGAASPEARATRRLRLLCRLRGSLRTCSSPSRGAQAKTPWLCGPRQDFAALGLGCSSAEQGYEGAAGQHPRRPSLPPLRPGTGR